MAEIKAFRAMRYSGKAGETDKLVCPPYDIISDDDKNYYLARSPYNAIRLELPKILSDNGNFDAYATANAFVRDWMGKGIIRNDDEPGIYIYENEFTIDGQRRKIKGFIALVKLEEFDKQVIIPHEETLSKAKDDRYNLMVATNCNFSQIYSLYSDEHRVIFPLADNASQGVPTYEFTDRDGVSHRLWTVFDKDIINALEKAFAEKKLYIADGHHRYETALRYRNYIRERFEEHGTSGYVPMMLVDMENAGLTVFPTHRIVRNLQWFDYQNIADRCREHFDVVPYLNREKGEIGLAEARKNGSHAFVFFVGNNNYTLLTLKSTDTMREYLPDATDAERSLDVNILHKLILERFFGIDAANMSEQANLSYTRSADEALAEVDGQRATCSFLMNPTRVSEITAIAESGGKMPQKSTYFFPKIMTGLVMNQIFKVED